MLAPLGLAIRPRRLVTAAFAILAAAVLRPGYLPVPGFRHALFASLLAAGVARYRLGPDVQAGDPGGHGPQRTAHI